MKKYVLILLTVCCTALTACSSDQKQPTCALCGQTISEEEHDLRVIRFSNDDVLRNIEGVCEDLSKTITTASHQNTP